MNLKSLTFLAILCLLATLCRASPLEFDFKDPKEISAVSLSIDSLLEPIVGYAKGISGIVQFDPLHPEKASGTIAVDVNSVQFSNDGYTETARNFALNGKKFPQLTLTLRKVLSVKESPKGHFEGEVLADFTCRGITQPKRLHLSANYFPGKAEERTGGRYKGDLLILRAKFSVSRTAHGISDGIPGDLVSDKIEVGVAIVGMHYTQAAETARATYCPAKEDPIALPSLQGGPARTLEAIQGRSNLVIFFVNEQCGVTFYYKERLLKLVKEFGPKGFTFVGVRVGRKQFPDQPVVLPEADYLKIPFLDDTEGLMMDRFHVAQSFTFAIIDRQQRLRYLGGLDDSVDPKKIKKTPLRDALQALAAGKNPPVAKADAIGCAILPVRKAS